MSDANTKTTALVNGGVLRKQLTERFTQIPNEVIRDQRLSFRAVGVLVHILSLPDGARVSAEALYPHHKEGREAVAAALRELTAQGYYRTEREQIERGRFVTYVYVTDVPGTTEHGKPGVGGPGVGGPEVGGLGVKGSNTRPEHLTLVVQPDGSTSEDDAPLPATVAGMPFPTAAAVRTGTAYPDAFAAFWTAYPRRLGKMAAYKAWLARLNEARRAGIDIDRRISAMVQAATNYAAHVQDKDTATEFVKHARTFLGPEDHWKEWAMTAAPDAGRARAPRDPNE